MSIQFKNLKQDPLPWLLEPDKQNPGIPYLALRDLLRLPEDDPQLCKVREDNMTYGPIPAILDAQHPEGYWAKPGGGHSPSYQVTVWQIIFLAELGANPTDERVRLGCDYFLHNSLAKNGAFAMNNPAVPSSVVHCLNGDPLYALLQLGFRDNPGVQSALEWQVRATIGDEELRYYKSGTTGPGFTCAYNGRQACAWGATKALKAFSSIPQDQRSPKIQRAIEFGAEFILSRDLAIADYPHTEKVSSTWFNFGFPLSYRSDILETMTALTELGYGKDARLNNALQLVLSKQDSQGRWQMERSLNGKMWAEIEEKGRPSKWLTLRALRVLQAAGLVQTR